MPLHYLFFSRLRDVSLDVANPSDELATTPLACCVELCFCPSEYNDTSCQVMSRNGKNIFLDLGGQADIIFEYTNYK